MPKRIWIVLCSLGFVTLASSACRPGVPLTPGKPTELPPEPTAAPVEPSPTLPSSPAGLPVVESANSHPPLWTFTTQGEVWGSPMVKDGVVFFGSDDHFLYAIDVTTHLPKWKFETGGLVRSRPAVVDRVVYFTSDDNFLYALSAESGQELWRFDLGKEIRPRGTLNEFWDYMQSSPAVADGVVYVGSSNPNFFAVDARTGQEKWRYKVKYYTRSSPAVVNGVVYVGESDSKLYALDAQTGTELWNFNTGSSVIPSPTVVDGVIYVGSKAPCVYAINAQNGEKIWCFRYPTNIAWVESSAAVANGTVYVGSSDWRRLNAIDAASGKLKWYFPTKGFPWCSPAVAEGVVYIGGTGGYFYAVDAETGEEHWKLQTGDSLETVAYGVSGGVVSSPMVADGVVYFGGLDGKLYAVSTE